MPDEPVTAEAVSSPPAALPDAAEPLAYASGGYGHVPYLANGGRATAAKVAMWVHVGLLAFDVVVGGAVWIFLATADQASIVRYFGGQTTESLVFLGAIGVLGVVTLIAFITAVVLYMVWQYRASRNLAALGTRHQRYTPGWGVGWWFVPFAFLVMPFRVLRELHDASRSGEGSLLVDCYSPLASRVWTLLILRILFDFFADVADGASDAGSFGTADYISGGFDMATSACFIGFVVLLIRLINEVEHRQRERLADA